MYIPCLSPELAHAHVAHLCVQHLLGSNMQPVSTMSIYVPTRVPPSPIPYMCLWGESTLTSTLNTLAHNGVVAMVLVYIIIAWQLWMACKDRHID